MIRSGKTFKSLGTPARRKNVRIFEGRSNVKEHTGKVVKTLYV